MILKIIIAFFPTIIQVVSYEIFHKKIMQSKKIDILKAKSKKEENKK